MSATKVEVTEAMLREAYALSDIKCPFDAAMKIDHLRISLRCMAMASAGKKSKPESTSPAHRAPATGTVIPPKFRCTAAWYRQPKDD